MSRKVRLPISFGGGEISPSIYGRPDLAQQRTGQRSNSGFYASALGSIINQPGTQYITGARTTSQKSRLIPFTFNRVQSYMLEFSHAKIRIIKDGALVESGGSPVEIATDYNIADIDNIYFTQSADTLYLTCDLYPPATLTRTSDIAWTLTYHTGTTLNGPYKAREEGDSDITFELTYSSGTLWNVVASSAVFTGLAANDAIKVGADIPGLSESLYWAWGHIDTYTSATAVTVDFGDIKPYYDCVLNGEFKEGLLEWDDLSNGTIAQNEVRYDVTTQHVVMYDNNAGTQTIIEQPVAVLANRIYEIRVTTGTISGSGNLNVKVGKASLGTYYVNHTGLTTSDTTYTDTFRTEGELIYVSIDTTTATSGETQEIASVEVRLVDHVTNNWRLPVFSGGLDEFPSRCLFHNNRLWFFNSPNYPDTFWASRLGDYLNLDDSTPIVDTDGFSFTLASEEINEILWAASHSDKGVLLGTTGGEYIVTGADGISLITPLSIKITQLGKNGSINLNPLVIGNSILFSPKGAPGIMELTFSLEAGGYSPRDITFFAKHLFKGRRIVSWTYQRYPDSLIWAVLDNGELVILSYLKEYGVNAFSRRISPLGVGYADISSIPDSDDDKVDDVYIVVNRAETGETPNYMLEIIEPAYVSQDSAYGKSAAGSPYDYRYLESAVRLDAPKTITGITKADPGVVTAVAHGFSNGDLVRIQNVIGMTEVNNVVYKVANKAADTFELNDEDDNDIDTTGFTTYLSGGEARKMVTSVSGLTHLEGETVTALADGEVYSATVSSGAITLGAAASYATVGLLVTPQLTTSSIDIALNSTGSIKNISRLLFYVIESLYFEARINSEEWKTFELTAAGESAPLVPFTGIVEIYLDSTPELDMTISVRNTKPLPLEISSIFVEAEVNT